MPPSANSPTEPEEREIAAFLSDPANIRGRVPHVDVVETHIARVFLVGEEVYKIKKRVQSAVRRFLDAGEPPPCRRARDRDQPAACARDLSRCRSDRARRQRSPAARRRGPHRRMGGPYAPLSRGGGADQPGQGGAAARRAGQSRWPTWSPAITSESPVAESLRRETGIRARRRAVDRGLRRRTGQRSRSRCVRRPAGAGLRTRCAACSSSAAAPAASAAATATSTSATSC